MVSIRVKTHSFTNVVAPRRVKRENVSFPVAVRRSKTPLLKLPNDRASHDIAQHVSGTCFSYNFTVVAFSQQTTNVKQHGGTVNSRHSGHLRDRYLVSVIARVCSSRVDENDRIFGCEVTRTAMVF